MSLIKQYLHEQTNNQMLYCVIGGYRSQNEDFESMMIFKDELSAIEYAKYLENEDGYDYSVIKSHKVRTIKNLHKEQKHHRIVTAK